MTIADVRLPSQSVVGAHWTPGAPASPTTAVIDPVTAATKTLAPRKQATESPAHVVCEALVVGCGVAGNAAALRLAESGVHVTMLSAADEPYQSATYWAQGGIIYKAKDDSPELLAADIHRAGAGVCDPEAVDKLTTEGPVWVEKMLLSLAQVPFHRDCETGELALTLEASHNRARILYKADHTGKAIQTSLVETVQKHPRITLLTARSAVELLLDADGVCRGVVALSKHDNAVQIFRSDFTLLATGGLGDLYVNTSNPQGARGDGVGLAARAGAALKNMQYVQFHPTTLYIPGERRFLLTEALRGEGAVLRDRHGRAFAKDYHPDGELAPRDVVARTILAEMAKQQEPCMFLDISHEDADWIKNRFPTIYAHCLAHGIDMTRQPMPVVPAAHYHCGGVEVDLHGRTSIRGLYAAGEVSCTGLHGANRLASTSLLEGLVWGCSAADHFLAARQVVDDKADSDDDDDDDDVAIVVPEVLRRREDGGRHRGTASDKELATILSTLQQVMWDAFGPLRTKAGMAIGLQELAALAARVEALFAERAVTHETASLRNAVAAAKQIARAAAAATCSVGTHCVV